MQCTWCDWWGKCTAGVTVDVDVDCATYPAHGPLLLCSWCIYMQMKSLTRTTITNGEARDSIDNEMLSSGETKNQNSVGEALRTPECTAATSRIVPPPSRPAHGRPDRAGSSSARPRSRSTRRRHGRKSEGPADEAAATPPQCMECGARNPTQLPKLRITNGLCRSCRWIQSLPTRIGAEWSRHIQEWEELQHEEVPDVRSITLGLIHGDLDSMKRHGSSSDSMKRHRSPSGYRALLASFEENSASIWSKEQCDQIIEAAEALPELTATENQIYGRALLGGNVL